MARARVKRRKPPANYDENPEWTVADFKRAKPLNAADPGMAAALKRGRGRPRVENRKVPVSLRLDPAVLTAYKATGEGWQRRIAKVLADGAKKLHAKA
jgi:uncharacterized protein (DUF4415 family)